MYKNRSWLQGNSPNFGDLINVVSGFDYMASKNKGNVVWYKLIMDISNTRKTNLNHLYHVI